MKHFNALLIIIDVAKIIEALQYKMRWVIKQACTFMVVYFSQKHFVGNPIVQVFTGMKLVPVLASKGQIMLALDDLAHQDVWSRNVFAHIVFAPTTI